jgi:nicotinamidase-related amidase
MNTQWRPGAGTVLAVVDMQEVFAQETSWQIPSFSRIVPAIQALATAYSARCIFTRFVYQDPDQWPGAAWQDYYVRWGFLKGRDDLAQIVEPLRSMARIVVDKPTYSCLNGRFMEEFRALGGQRLIFAGVETDACVMASVFDAIDAGYPCAVVKDACTSSLSETHAAALAIFERLPDQICILRTADLLPGWPDGADGQT